MRKLFQSMTLTAAMGLGTPVEAQPTALQDVTGYIRTQLDEELGPINMENIHERIGKFIDGKYKIEYYDEIKRFIVDEAPHLRARINKALEDRIERVIALSIQSSPLASCPYYQEAKAAVEFGKARGIDLTSHFREALRKSLELYIKNLASMSGPSNNFQKEMEAAVELGKTHHIRLDLSFKEGQ